MKVNDYVRTPQGIIAKIVNIQEDTGQYFLNGNAVSLESKNYIADKNITIGENFKHSPNIIDLIEPLDLMFIDIDNDNEGGIIVPRIAETKNELKGYIDNFKDNTYQLKGIITHEQIESMEYKVKE